MATFSTLPKFYGAAWIKINCLLTLTILILLVLHFADKKIRYYETSPEILFPKVKAFSGCCTFPCVNGLCISTEGNDYRCICTSASYSGKDCENVNLLERLKNNIWGDSDLYEKYTTSKSKSLFWRYINIVPPLSNYYNKKIYYLRSYVIDDNLFDPTEVDGYIGGRSLASVPTNCPTPMGMKGLLQLPNIEDLWSELFKGHKFQSCTKGSNFLFLVYIQHFFSQFKDIKKSWKRYEYPFNMANIYGRGTENKLALRRLKGGKLKTRIFKHEEYPPFLSDCPALEEYYTQWLPIKKRHEWAIGLPELGDNLFLFVMSTIWLREHNRVCDILSNEHRDWTDEQLYETAKHIVTGETIKITLTEYLQQLLQFDLKINYEPSLLTNMRIKYGARVPIEPFLVPIWHTSLPEKLTIDNRTYPLEYLNNLDSNIIINKGMDSIINAMATSSAGEFAASSIGPHEETLIKEMIQAGRDARLQSFNNYRRKFGLKPFSSFYELTGDVTLAEKLQNMYFDVDALELPIGLLMERKKATVLPPGMTTMAGSWLIHLLLSHPINSPELHKPETFGGKTGHNIIKTATLKKLFCLNLSSRCKHVYVDFKLPKALMYKVEQTNKN